MHVPSVSERARCHVTDRRCDFSCAVLCTIENISPSVTSNATVAATKLSTSVTTAGSEGSSISNRAVPEDNSADKPIVKTTPRTGTAPVYVVLMMYLVCVFV